MTAAVFLQDSDTMRQKDRIAHLFPSTGPHLCRTLAPIAVRAFPDSSVYMWSWTKTGRNGECVSPLNREWMEALPPGTFAGCIDCSRLICGGRTKWKRRLNTILSALLVPRFNLVGWYRIWRGPKNWLLHGGLPLSFPTMLAFKLLGKRVAAIHWGLPLGSLPWLQWSFDWSCLMMTHVFVLMTPELDFFEKYVRCGRLSVLPYPGKGIADLIDSINCEPTDELHRTIILGNSTYNLDFYREILEKTPPGSWNRIICMLNYGRESEAAKTDAFVAWAQEKFSGSFHAWRETVPMNEYLKIMDSADFYLGPAIYQSGLGAIYRSIAAGKVVALRGHNYRWLANMGAAVANIDEIDDYSFETLSKIAPTAASRRENRSMLRQFFASVNTEGKWAHEIAAVFRM